MKHVLEINVSHMQILVFKMSHANYKYNICILEIDLSTVTQGQTKSSNTTSPKIQVNRIINYKWNMF